MYRWLGALLLVVGFRAGRTEFRDDFLVASETILSRLFVSATSGCFVAPRGCPNRNVTFHLYTSSDTTAQVLDPSNPDTLTRATFNPGKPIKFIIHGYSTSKDDICNTQLRPAYFSVGSYNIISVDYAPLVADPCYPWAASNLPLVGECCAQMIDLLVTRLGIPLDSFHVIGYSMGAHVAGNIRNYLKAGRIQRITGLDPAKPLFEVPNQFKLDAGDAEFVDVVHTNSFQRGKLEVSGHVDVYVNGGFFQPGCSDPNLDISSACAHNRVPVLFAESITTPTGFWSYPCPEKFPFMFYFPCAWRIRLPPVLMGEFIDRSARGIYFLETNANPPYARGQRSWEMPRVPYPQGWKMPVPHLQGWEMPKVPNLQGWEMPSVPNLQGMYVSFHAAMPHTITLPGPYRDPWPTGPTGGPSPRAGIPN